MSEEERLVYLNKIKDFKKRERNGYIEFILGIIIFILGFGFISVIYLGGAWIGVAGLILTITGIFEKVYFHNQYNKLIKENSRSIEDKNTIKILKCSKCGKEVSKGDYKFCPFCGELLKS